MIGQDLSRIFHTLQVTVGFVDYGNEETVDAVVELPPALASVPFFAIQMSLYGLESAFPNKSSENAQKVGFDIFFFLFFLNVQVNNGERVRYIAKLRKSSQ